MAAITFDRHPRFEELTAWLHDLAADHPGLLTLSVLGRSHEGRELWLATVTDASTGPHHDKPAIWLDGNIHATETTASVALVHLLHHLCTRHGVDDRITRALRTRTFYVVPRVNPDGAELALAEVPFTVRSTTRAWPDLDQADGLVAGDVDHDGRSLQMRLLDPNGTWKADRSDPRLLVPRAPDEDGDGPYYRLLREGRVHGYDGVRVAAAAPLAGIDSNRNFPFEWKRRPGGAPWGAGDFPTSEPEVRAVVQGVVDRPNVCVYFAYHTWSGVHLRPYGNQPDEAFESVDLWTYEALGARATEITGYPSISTYHGFRYDPKRVITGTGSDWAFDQLGLISWTTEFWNPLRAAGLPDAHPIEWYRRHPFDEELALLAWVDDNVPNGYVDWYPFDHPELGPVELGGWDSAAVFRNPPDHLLEAEVGPHSELAVFHALLCPQLRLRESIVEPAGEGVWRVRVVVENTGWLPTNVTQQALERHAVRPIAATIELPEGAVLVGGGPRVELGQLAGRALRESSIGMFAGAFDGTDDRSVAEWLVRADEATTVDVVVRHDRAGTVRTTVTLSAG
jgi:hypothetical protein